MSKIRMNTEFRNKFLNRYVDYAEKEITQESDAFNDAREKVDSIYPKAFELATKVVKRSYPEEDVATCRTLKQKYGQPLDVVAKDKCFYFSYAKENLVTKMKMKATEMSANILTLVCSVMLRVIMAIVEIVAKQFAYAYKREELKAKELQRRYFCTTKWQRR